MKKHTNPLVHVYPSISVTRPSLRISGEKCTGGGVCFFMQKSAFLWGNLDRGSSVTPRLKLRSAYYEMGLLLQWLSLRAFITISFCLSFMSLSAKVWLRWFGKNMRTTVDSPLITYLVTRDKPFLGVCLARKNMLQFLLISSSLWQNPMRLDIKLKVTPHDTPYNLRSGRVKLLDKEEINNNTRNCTIVLI